MIKVRKGTFETNSSSTHSITMCTKSEYDQWKNGEIYWYRWGDRFVSKAEVEEKMAKAREDYFASYPRCSEEDFLQDFIDEEGYYTFTDYCEKLDYETFHDEFTTPSGEVVIAFGYYGYDG